VDLASDIFDRKLSSILPRVACRPPASETDARRIGLFVREAAVSSEFLLRGPHHWFSSGFQRGWRGLNTVEWQIDLIRSVPDVLTSTVNYLKGYGWMRGAPFHEGTANDEVLKEWNKSAVYQKTISVFAARLMGGAE
jgi:hypothetical protein